jgi:hypothetical protein
VPDPDPLVLSDGDTLRQFREASETADAVGRFIERLRRGVESKPPPQLHAPETPADADIADYVDPTERIGWNNPATVPGNVAGAMGDVEIGGRLYPDARRFDGRVQFLPTATASGVLRRVEARADLRLKVDDAVDLCRGAFGAGIERPFTIPLSRLEITPRSSGGY